MVDWEKRKNSQREGEKGNSGTERDRQTDSEKEKKFMCAHALAELFSQKQNVHPKRVILIEVNQRKRMIWISEQECDYRWQNNNEKSQKRTQIDNKWQQPARAGPNQAKQSLANGKKKSTEWITHRNNDDHRHNA